MVAKVKDQFVFDFLPGKTATGAPAITVICKRGYRIDEVEARAVPLEDEEQPELYGDLQLYEGSDPSVSSAKLDSDYKPFKKRVDVFVVGNAMAPHGIPTETFDVSVRIGGVERSLRIVGPRFVSWRKQKKGSKKKRPPFVPPLISEPEPIRTVPLRFEYAFGGTSRFIPEDEAAYAEAMEAQQAKVEEEQLRKEEEEKKAREEAGKESVRALKEEFSKGPDADDFFTQSSSEGADDGETASSKLAGDGTQILTPDALEEARTLEEEQRASNTPKQMEGDVVVSESVLSVHEEQEPSDAEDVQQTSGTQVLDLKNEGDIRVSDDAWVKEASDGREGAGKRKEVTEEDPLEDYPPLAYPQNPVGMGYVASRDERLVEGLPLPLIEHPEHPIGGEDVLREMDQLLEEGPRPGGFGVVAGGWKPRMSFAGVPEEHLEQMEENKEKRRLELDPEDEEQRMEIQALLDQEAPVFQPEWYNAAVSEWQLDRVDGNEDVVVRNMTEGGTLFFKLPGDRPLMTLDRGRGHEAVKMEIDTLSLLVEEMKVEVVWRGHVPYTGPDELAEYPRLELDVEAGEWREEMPKRKRPDHDGGTQILNLEDLEELEESSEEPRPMEEPAVVSLDDARDEEGTLREDRLGDIRHGDDSWVQEALSRMDEERDEAAMEMRKTETEERKAKVEAVKERLAEIEAETKKKGSGKKGKK